MATVFHPDTPMKPICVPVLAALCLPAVAQQPDSAKTPGSAEVQAAALLPAEALVRMEVFSLAPGEARRAMKQFPKQADLYAWLGAELEKEKPAATLELLTVLRVRSGQRSKLEQIAEYSYATEFDPPNIPQHIGIGFPVSGGITTHITNKNPAPAPAPTPPAPAPKPGAPGDPGPPGTPAPVTAPGASPAGRVFAPWPYTPTTPSAFTFKNTGWTAEIELTIGDDGRTVDLNMAPQFVKLCGLVSQNPTGEIMQPTFETSKYTGQILTTLGQPTLAGTFSPPVATGVEGSNNEHVTRLLFVTVTDPR